MAALDCTFLEVVPPFDLLNRVVDNPNLFIIDVALDCSFSLRSCSVFSNRSSSSKSKYSSSSDASYNINRYRIERY